MDRKPSRKMGTHCASPPCYAREVDPDYLWRPESPPTDGEGESPVNKPQRQE